MTPPPPPPGDPPGTPAEPLAIFPPGAAPPPKWSLASIVLLNFVVTFILSRVMVLLIMTHRVPSFYLHVKGTHVHHLNYGIFILSVVGALLILRQPKGRALNYTAGAYGIGLALTFDEFGMWVHLGGPYWQRASFDAVVVIMALLGLYEWGPSLKRFTQRNWIAAALLAVAIAGFAVVLVDSMRFAGEKLSPILQEIEAGSPP
jgi:hypothetical protein